MFSKNQNKLKTVQLITNERNYLLNGLHNKLQIVQLISKQKKLSTQWISTLLKGFHFNLEFLNSLIFREQKEEEEDRQCHENMN